MLANRATQVIDEQGIVGHDHEHAAPLLDEFAHCFFVRALLLQKTALVVDMLRRLERAGSSGRQAVRKTVDAI